MEQRTDLVLTCNLGTINGGAGTMDKSKYAPEQLELYRAALRDSLHAGHQILKAGGTALDAVTAAVTSMENCPLFNSGYGAVFNTEGKNELEASIACSRPPKGLESIAGKRRGASVTQIKKTRNPIQLCRSLYLAPELTPHFFHSSPYVEDVLAPTLGIPLVEPSYYFTEARWLEHRRGLGLPTDPSDYPAIVSHSEIPTEMIADSIGETVGAVALDQYGAIAAATSTGGRTNKLPGRAGDTPMHGSGFFADSWEVDSGPVVNGIRKMFGWGKKEKAVGISGTGEGDYFIRLSTCSTFGHLVKYNYASLTSAAKRVIADLVDGGAGPGQGGTGGVIAVNEAGDVAMEQSHGMYRGVCRADGVAKVAIFGDDIVQ